MAKNTKTKRKIVLISILCFVAILIIGWWALCVKIYDDSFNIRANSYEPLMLRVQDFEGLNCAEYSFPSDKGQMLAGYLYSSGENQRGIVVIAHGFGSGHNSYMDCASYFAHNGYYVFAYDATAMDKSGGEGLGGVPQGLIDLDRAISFIQSNDEIPHLPIVLFGHSWGAYCVSAVLTYHPEVKAVIECCGFNKSSDMFESGGKSQAGSIIYLMVPFVKIHEMLKYGGYALNSAIKGFDSSAASVMVVHSADDDVIGIEYGLDRYIKKYKDDSRFVFVRFEDRGHNAIFYRQNDTYKDEFNVEFNKWRDALNYDYTAKENKDRFAKDKAEYITKNLDHARWSNRLDEDLFRAFVNFYDKSIM